MGEFNSGDHYIYYCGQESLGRNGVALIVNHRVWNVILGYSPKNDRIIPCFQDKPFSITVIQVYAPSTNAEEAEWFYEDLQDFLELTPKKDVLFIIGDWDAKVWSQEIHRLTGKFGLGVQNEAGQRLIEFCQENALVIENTLLQQPKRWLYTRTSPGGQNLNQIDYILCSQRWRSSVQWVKPRPGADCGLDHEHLIAKFRLKLMKVGENTRPFRYAEKAMAPHSSTLAWKIPWMEEPGRLQSLGSLRVRHNWATSLLLFTFMHWRRKWQPLQCSCLENPRDGGAWWAAVYGVTQSRTWLKQLSSSSSIQVWPKSIPLWLYSGRDK